MRRVLLVVAVVFLSGCASTAPRPATSSYGCMRAAIDGQLPPQSSDKRKHCIAAALITYQCSVTEAYLASIATEVVDWVGPGDAQWDDWRADRAGIACASVAAERSSLDACCEQRGF